MTRSSFLRLLLAAPSCAQTSDQWDFLSDPSVFADVRGSLDRYLKARAFELLDKRKQTIAQVKTTADLEARRRHIRERIWTYLGGQPERTPLNPRVVATVDRGDHRIEKVIFESRPDFHVTANLYLPKTGTQPWPGILYPLGHERGAKAHEAWQRCLVNLTRRGFVCLAWDPVGQGERVQFYDEDWHDSKLQGSTVEHTVLGLQCQLLGTHIAQFTIWDGIRALDYLTSRPEVDSKRIGCTGNSGGGTHTAYLAALDDRIHVAAPSCYITSWKRLLESIGPQDSEQVFPLWLNDGFDYPDFLYAFGSKPYLILSAMRDFFPIQGARASFEEARAVFARTGAAEQVAMFEFDDGHGYSAPRRERAYRWFARWLQSADNTQPESAVELLRPDELNCTPTGQVKTSLPSGKDVYAFNQELLTKLRSARRFSADSVRARVRELVRFESGSGAPRSARFGEITRPKCRVEKLTYESEPGVVIPALLFVASDGPARKPAIVFADAQGKAAAASEAEQLAAAGWIVLTPDVRGCGELQPQLDRRDYFVRNFGNYEHATTAVLIGKTMAGMQALDVVRGVDLLATRGDVDAPRIAAAGRGAAALAVLLATVCDDRLACVALDRMLVSWERVVKERIHQDLAAQIVPSALQHFDLPDLVAAVAPRGVALYNAVNPLGQELPAEDTRIEYARAIDVYKSLKASSALQIAVRNRDEQPFAPILQKLFSAE